ncbi:MAG: hypothetical protein ACK4OM_00110 [Alphaproteobacteria bacterium]
MTNIKVSHNPVLTQFFLNEVNIDINNYLRIQSIENGNKVFVGLLSSSVIAGGVFAICNYFDISSLTTTVLTTSIGLGLLPAFIIDDNTDFINILNSLNDGKNLEQIQIPENVRKVYYINGINIFEYKDKIKNGELEFLSSENLHLETKLVKDPGIISKALYSAYEYITGNEVSPTIIAAYEKDLTFDSFVNPEGEVIMIGTDGYDHSIMDLIT